MSDNDVLKRIFTCIDNTTLNGTDNDVSVSNFCANTLSMQVEGKHVASVCLYPSFVEIASSLLSSSGIVVASVAGAFPTGHSPLEVRRKEIEMAVAAGAAEIDTVINRGAVIAMHYEAVLNDLKALRAAANGVTLKVILETGELNAEQIKISSELAIEAGADFIKTSTGKIAAGASPEAAEVMLSVIKKHYEATGKVVGFKASGGISSADDALVYAKLAMQYMGEDYLSKTTFRIGASRLTNRLFHVLTL